MCATSRIQARSEVRKSNLFKRKCEMLCSQGEGLRDAMCVTSLGSDILLGRTSSARDKKKTDPVPEKPTERNVVISVVRHWDFESTR
jgi:hypothetical protein